ncbi:40110_t:CDS:2, partial [Gigaspora margarita]
PLDILEKVLGCYAFLIIPQDTFTFREQEPWSRLRHLIEERQNQIVAKEKGNYITKMSNHQEELSRHTRANRNKKLKRDYVLYEPEVSNPIVKDDIIFDPDLLTTLLLYAPQEKR